ncbi:MAG: thiamine ABC transporter substrate-binding protein [Acidimicrobiia bacterium]
MRRLLSSGATILLACTALVACSGSGSSRSVTLVTHDSFAVANGDLRAFEREHDVDVRILKSGDAGSALNQIILTKGEPLGDVMFGVDNTFLTRATKANVFEPYESAALANVPAGYELDPSHELTPIDFGDVCVNYDRAALATKGVPAPTSLDDLVKPPYRGMLVVENAASSSPGLAFLLATVAKYGDGWRDYWADLRANGVKVDDGWEQAYFTDFAGGGQGGTFPLVVSYASSPPAGVTEGTPDEAPTAAVLDTCFRQVEFAGVLRGAEHPALARDLVDWMLSERFQAGVPDQMYVYPVRDGVAVPATWARYAPVPPDPFEVAPARIDRNRTTWIDQWTDTVLR